MIANHWSGRSVLRHLLAALGAAFAAGLIAATAAPAASAAECPNEAIRTQQGSAYLPECRAYEMVSPVGALPEINFRASAAAEGPFAGAIGWRSAYPPPASAVAAQQFVSTRGSSGWTTSAATPNHSVGDSNFFSCDPFIFFSPSLEAGVVGANRESDAADKGEREYCQSTQPYPLVPGEPEGAQNLFRRDNSTGEYSLVNVTPEGATPSIATFQDASADMSSVLFSEEAALTPEAPPGEDLYVESGGSVRLVTILPNGAPGVGSVVNATGHVLEAPRSGFAGGSTEGAVVFTHAMSSDGSRVIFEAAGKLYLRVNATQPQSAIDPAHETAVNGEQCAEPAMACTMQLDASQAAGPGGGATFLWANETDTKILLMDKASAALTGDTRSGSGENLYEYTLPVGASTGTLTDLTPVAHAEVLGISGLGESEGRTFAYFVSQAALSSRNAEGTSPAEGEPNLYMLEEGHSPVLIATLSPNDSDWTGRRPELLEASAYEGLRARVSPNGLFIAFTSHAKPTGYDNTDASTGEPDSEIYVYEASAATLHCASCDSNGASPAAATSLTAPASSSAANTPAYLQRAMLDDGAVIFDTSEALLPSLDTNGQRDVYEYRSGTVSLISSGTAPDGAEFAEVTPDGKNVYFITTQSLVASDTDNAQSLYDARVGGGLPEPAAQAPKCAGSEECQGAGAGPGAFTAPASVSFAGPGNIAPAAAKGQPTNAKTKSAKHALGARLRRRRRRLHRALRRCTRRYRHSRHERLACKRRAHKRFGVRAKRARLHGYAHHRHHGGAR